MSTRANKLTLHCGVLMAGLLACDIAHAFRCKNKIVTEGMHEQQVIAACGEPTTRRVLGQTVRGYVYGWSTVGPWETRRRVPGYTLSEEVIVTEYTYNFGPRKLMRRLVFTGGVLESIETIGYGYLEKDPG